MVSTELSALKAPTRVTCGGHFARRISGSFLSYDRAKGRCGSEAGIPASLAHRLFHPCQQTFRAYGSAADLNRLVNEKLFAPHIPVIDKSKRDDGTFSREDFSFDKARDLYICPAGELLRTTGTVSTDYAMRYIAPVPVCRACPLKPKCCPNMPARRVVRDINEDARDVARALAKSEAFEQSSPRPETCRDAVRSLETHLADRPSEITRTARSPVRVHFSCHRPEPAPLWKVRRVAQASSASVRWA